MMEGFALNETKHLTPPLSPLASDANAERENNGGLRPELKL